MPVALGALGRLFPRMVLHGDICSIFNQGLWENAEARDRDKTSLATFCNDRKRKVNGTFPASPIPVTRAHGRVGKGAKGIITHTREPLASLQDLYQTPASEPTHMQLNPSYHYKSHPALEELAGRGRACRCPQGAVS